MRLFMKYATIFLMLGVLLYGTTARAEAPQAQPIPYGAQPLVLQPEDVPDSGQVSVHDISRGSILLGPVVLDKVPGQLSLSFHGFQVLELQYSPTEYFQLGAAAILPVLGLGGVGTFRFNWNINDYCGFGIGGFGGGFAPLGSLVTDGLWWLAGLHTGVSFIAPHDIVINVGLIITTVGWFRMRGFDDEKMQRIADIGIVPLPHMGVIVPISSRWAFVGELFFPITEVSGRCDEYYDEQDDSDIDENCSGGYLDLDLDLEYENPFMLYYGFRYSKDWLFADMGFFIPMQPELIKWLMYCPPGLPYASLGVRF